MKKSSPSETAMTYWAMCDVLWWLFGLVRVLLSAPSRVRVWSPAVGVRTHGTLEPEICLGLPETSGDQKPFLVSSL